MKGAILISGGTAATREQKSQEIILELGLKNSHPDLLEIQKEEKKKNIGVAQAKEVTKFISQKPFSGGNKAVVISDTHTMSAEAQNALLKTLEELPTYATVMLLAENKGNLLDTVVSRCKQIRLNNTKGGKANIESVSLDDFLNASVGKRLEIAAELGKEDRDYVCNVLETWSRVAVEKTSKAAYVDDVAQKFRTTNLNQKLALEYLAVVL